MHNLLHHLLVWIAPLGAFLIAVGKAIQAAAGPKAPQSPPDAPPSAPEPSPLPDSQTTPQAPCGPQIAPDGLTARAAAEVVGHEAIVLEAYKDSRGIWTWGIGVTDASGHLVERYIDHPAPILECLAVFVWLLRQKYLPAVLDAFAGFDLTEAELAAALSFHYNTGAILHASWVDHWKANDLAGAKSGFMQWDKPASVLERRQKECDLFFDGKWSGDGEAPVYPVFKPSYQPDFRHPTRIDVLTPLKALIGQ